MVDAATARLEIQELARLPEHRVGFPAQDPFIPVHLGVTDLRDFFGHTEVFREPANVARCDLDALVDGTTVSGALDAIVIRSRLGSRGRVTHDRSLSPIR